MSNIQQLLDPWVYIIILKYESTLEKHLTKLQNLTLYNTNLKFLYIIAKGSLTHVSLITLKRLEPMDENSQGILHKKQTNFCVSELYFSNVPIFLVLSPEHIILA